jgi:hypothetical protein
MAEAAHLILINGQDRTDSITNQTVVAQGISLS